VVEISKPQGGGLGNDEAIFFQQFLSYQITDETTCSKPSSFNVRFNTLVVIGIPTSSSLKILEQNSSSCPNVKQA
jgi:hypothetical protein